MWTRLDSELLAILPKRSPPDAVDGPSGWGDVKSKLDRFRVEYIHDDWDGQGAAAIPIEVAESAIALAAALDAAGIAAPDWVIASYESSIRLEWSGHDGQPEIELEVTGSQCLEVTHKNVDEQYETFTVSGSVVVA